MAKKTLFYITPKQNLREYKRLHAKRWRQLHLEQCKAMVRRYRKRMRRNKRLQAKIRREALERYHCLKRDPLRWFKFRKKQKSYTRKNADRIKKYKRRYRTKNRDRLRQKKKREYRACGESIRKKNRRKYRDNRKKILLMVSRYRRRNLKLIRKKMREHYHRHKKLYQKRRQQWKAANPGYDASYRHARRKMIKRNGRGDPKQIRAYYRYIRQAVLILCHWCGSPVPRRNRSVDHRIPITRGGRHCVSNFVPSCRSCNSRKSDMLPHEFIKRMKEDRRR